MSLSRRLQLKAEARKLSLIHWLNTIDVVLDNYIDCGGAPEMEAHKISKIALFLMAGHYLKDEGTVILFDGPLADLANGVCRLSQTELKDSIEGPDD